MPRNGKLVRITLALAAVGLVAALAVATAGVASAKSTRSSAATLNGAGSSFVSPLVQAWVGPVKSARDITLNYSAVGSGAGIAAITGRTVDFGASDAPLTPDQFSACKGCVQIPWALASTSVFYNLPGVKTFLHMSGKVLVKIYLGKITNWNDPAIKKINPGTNLPDQPITVVHRSDGSGTTYNFTDYLSSVSKTWKTKVGKGTAVNWPTGTGAPHSSGVANVVRQTPGRDRLRGNRVSGQEPPAVLQDAEPERSFRSPGFWQARWPRRSSRRIPRRTARCRSSIRPSRGSTGTPIRSLRTRTSCSRSRARKPPRSGSSSTGRSRRDRSTGRSCSSSRSLHQS